MAVKEGAAEGGGKKDVMAEPPNTARRDKLNEVARKWQAKWEESKEYEVDAEAGKTGTAEEKFMCTFPYPYMNGRLHVGHAFTITKAEFAARYQRLLGKNVLYPFAFHCTGMPIQAAANRLARELDAEAEAAKEEEGAEEEGGAEEADAGEAAMAAADAAILAKTKFTSKRTKAVSKGGGGGMTQAKILEKSGIPADEVAAFRDPAHWLDYFPPRGRSDLKLLGVAVDWRRSFITTSVNPFYDAFVRWHFRTLFKAGKVVEGTRPTIYSELDGQACADHERAEGEGVGPQEYSLIKMQVKPSDRTPEVLKPFVGEAAGGAATGASDGGSGKAFLVAATLRPETMYGQTNCFVLPEGEYGVYRMKGGDVFVCSERSARNMSYQDLTEERGKLDCLGTVTGMDLMGIPLAAPNAAYETVYTLPLLTISMGKGTGVVTSVPSDAPDDYAALQDLKNKEALRAKFNITDEMVVPYDVVEIIDIPGLGKRAAVTLCEELGIKSQNDRDKLAEAKSRVYLKGFYEGVLLVGSQTGVRVEDAKPKVRAEMIAAGQALPYWEPESKVVSRSGDECVVAFLEQWYLPYGEESWKEVVKRHVHSDRFTAYTPAALTAFDGVLDWLRDWACSRSFGLGTKLPMDERFVIESLSDSTIYMAYYTIAHLLQGSDLDGASGGPLGIRPEQLSDEVFDYIFRKGPAPTAEGAPAVDVLDRLRAEFEYWYPMDLRVSGRDLIQNHLTMSLYNHAAVWEGDPDRMPQSFFANGHVLINKEKMSKQKGNFITLLDGQRRFSPDALRFALATAGDGLEDANFETELADKVILTLTKELEWAEEMKAAIAKGSLRRAGRAEGDGVAAAPDLTFVDRLFLANMDLTLAEAKEAYDAMRYRDVIQHAFYRLLSARDQYREISARLEVPMEEGCVRAFLDAVAIVNSPICPHWSEEVYHTFDDARGSVARAQWPTVPGTDRTLATAARWVDGALHGFRTAILDKRRAEARRATREKREPVAMNQVTIFAAPTYVPWQRAVLEALREAHSPEAAEGSHFPKDVMKRIGAALSRDKSLKKHTKNAMKFAAGRIEAVNVAHGSLEPLADHPAFSDMDTLDSLRDYVVKMLHDLDVASVTIISTADATPEQELAAEAAIPGAPAVDITE